MSRGVLKALRVVSSDEEGPAKDPDLSEMARQDARCRSDGDDYLVGQSLQCALENSEDDDSNAEKPEPHCF